MKARQESIPHMDTSHKLRAEYLAPTGFVLAVITSGAAALSGLGSRWGWWYFMIGFSILKWSVVGGIAAIVISSAGGIAKRRLTHRHNVLFAIAGVTIGFIVAGIPLSWMYTAERLPQIHDISTDLSNPPTFLSTTQLKKELGKPPVYPGAEIAAQQRAAYPDIRSIILPVTPGIAFDSALKVVRSMGWRIIEADATAGRIQASATTFWFGFTDDVVVRIISAAGGCKVDVRSVSRVGRSDLGTNAKRIRTFLRKLERASMTDTTYRMGQRSFAFASHTRKESIGQ